MKVIIREFSVVDAETREKLAAVLKKIGQTVKKKWPDSPEPWILTPGTGDVNRVVMVAQMASWTAHEEFIKEFGQDTEILPLRDEYKRLVTTNVVTQYTAVD